MQWAPRIRKLFLCLLGLYLLGPGPRTVARENTADEQANEHPGSVEIQMQNVNFRLTRDIALEVRSLRGQLQRTKPDTPVTFDDPVYFTKPWSVSLNMKRQKYDIMEMICTDNNQDIPHYITSKPKQP